MTLLCHYFRCSLEDPDFSARTVCHTFLFLFFISKQGMGGLQSNFSKSKLSTPPYYYKDNVKDNTSHNLAYNRTVQQLHYTCCHLNDIQEPIVLQCAQWRFMKGLSDVPYILAQS